MRTQRRSKQVEDKYSICVLTIFHPFYLPTCLNVALIAFRPIPVNNVHSKTTIFSLQKAPWGAEPEFEFWPALQRANELTTELRRILTELHSTLADLHCTLAELRRTQTKHASP